MNKRWFAVIGVPFVIVPAIIIVSLGTVPTDDPIVTAGFVLIPLSGVLSILGGWGASVKNFAWYQLVGLSNAVFGFWAVVYAISLIVADYPDFSSVFVLSMVGLGCFSLALLGLDWLVGAPYSDIDAYS